MSPAEREPRFDEAPERLARELATRHHGLLTADQARRLGVSRQALSRRTRNDLWKRVLPRVYCLHAVPPSREQTALAAAMWAGDGAVVSHRSAGLLWGIHDAPSGPVDVTVPYGRAPRHPEVRVHRTGTLHAVDRDTVNGIPVTSPARTLIELAAVVRGEGLEATMEEAFRRRLCRPSFLEWRLRELGGEGGQELPSSSRCLPIAATVPPRWSSVWK